MAAGNLPKKPSNTEGVEPNDTHERFIMTGDEKDATDFESIRIAPSEDMTLWQSSDKWPQPKWLSQTRGQKPKEKSSYRDFYLNSLRSRYLDLEADFRTGYNNFYNSKYMDLNTAQIVIGYLQAARKALEGQDGDIYDIVTMLNFADQGTVGLYPPHVAKARAMSIGSDLKAQGSPWGDYLLGEAADPNQTLGGLRSALERTKNALNEAAQSALISTGLQIERLKTTWMWALIVLAATLAFLPMIVSYDDTFWAKTAIGKAPEFWRPWYVAFTMAIFGIGGAFFSSLIQVQTSTATLSDFQEKQKESQLKFAVGGIAALITFIFLSWDVLPGVQLKNAGSMLFFAFVVGFSERYFLRFLNIENQNATPMPSKPAPVAVERPSIEPQEATDVAHADVNNDKINQ
jgi:hypothetical protein